MSVEIQGAFESTINHPFLVRTSLTAWDEIPEVVSVLIEDPVFSLEYIDTCLVLKPEYLSIFSITLLRSKHNPVFASYNYFGSLSWLNGKSTFFGAIFRTER